MPWGWAASFCTVFQFLEVALGNSARWPKIFQPALYKCSDVASGLQLLRRVEVAIVLCDQQIPGT